MKNKPEYLVIVNPNAGMRRGERDWDKISGLLRQSAIIYRAFFTRYRGHAIELTTKAIREGFRKIIVVGGDGTMNEVINGIFNQESIPTTEILVGMITVGTGNDWGRMFKIPLDYNDAIDVITRNTNFIQDAGIVHYYQNKTLTKRYFLNIAGIGFDALVVSKTNKMKDNGHGGTWAYLKSLILSLLKYSFTKTAVRIDKYKINNDIFNISVGICKYNGGGMIQAPEAIADDGLFDITIIKKIRKFDIILSLRRLYDGTLGNHKKVEIYRGNSVFIDSVPRVYLETDGESLGHSPIHLAVIPRSINIITGNPELHA